MPRLTRWSLKLALFYLILALLLNTALAIPTEWHNLGGLVRFRPAVLHLFLFGWITQFIFGVANWLFPRFSRERFNLSPTLAWGTFLTLNGGLLLRLIAEPYRGQWPGIMVPLLVASGILQGLSGLFFVANLWTRIKGT